MGTLENARVDEAGAVRGADERLHHVFKLERDSGPTLYGDYFYVFPDPKGSDFDIEIGVFGFRDPRTAVSARLNLGHEPSSRKVTAP